MRYGCMVRQRQRRNREMGRSTATLSACKDHGRAAIAAMTQNTVAPLCADMLILQARKRGKTVAKPLPGPVPGQSSAHSVCFCPARKNNRHAGDDLTVDVPGLRRACLRPWIPADKPSAWFL